MKNKKIPSNQLTAMQVQLRIIWDHVRWLAETNMVQSVENKRKLQLEEKRFAQAEQLLKS